MNLSANDTVLNCTAHWTHALCAQSGDSPLLGVLLIVLVLALIFGLLGSVMYGSFKALRDSDEEQPAAVAPGRR